MRRRDFLKLSGLVGLSLVSPLTLHTARAAETPYEGTFWILVNAAGGWDPTSLCDPKGRINEDQPDPVNNYLTSDIRQVGNLRYAPIEGNKEFFEKYYNRLCVINGVDTKTNSHDVGSRHTWTGSLTEGLPAFAGLVAAAYAPEKPLAFVTNGGYDYTGGLLAPTRIGSTDTLNRLAYTNRMNPSDPRYLYHTEDTMTRIRAAQQARHEHRLNIETLPRIKESMSKLYLAHTGNNELNRLLQYLPENMDTDNSLLRQARVALAAYRAGLSVAVNINYGGFDTHGNHDDSHYPRLKTLLEGIDLIMQEAEMQQVADRVVVVVGSDFGRTPSYNSSRGKDHWSITSMMMMGQGIVGNQVIGLTDEKHRAIPINLETLQADQNGLTITPTHVHKALHKLAGLPDTELGQRYGYDVEDLPILA